MQGIKTENCQWFASTGTEFAINKISLGSTEQGLNESKDKNQPRVREIVWFNTKLQENSY